MELVDMLDLGSSAARRGGSSPSTRTSKSNKRGIVFLFYAFLKIMGIQLFFSC